MRGLREELTMSGVPIHMCVVEHRCRPRIDGFEIASQACPEEVFSREDVAGDIDFERVNKGAMHSSGLTPHDRYVT